MATQMRIGELAEQAGVNPKTVRYYEDIGVLPPSQRSESGHRVFGHHDLERLTFVRTAQRLGFSLDEIREVLAFRDRNEQPCAFVLDTLTQKVSQLDQRIAEMSALRDQLVQLQQAAQRLRGRSACYCSVIEHNQKATARSS